MNAQSRISRFAPQWASARVVHRPFRILTLIGWLAIRLAGFITVRDFEHPTLRLIAPIPLLATPKEIYSSL